MFFYNKSEWCSRNEDPLNDSKLQVVLVYPSRFLDAGYAARLKNLLLHFLRSDQKHYEIKFYAKCNTIGTNNSLHKK